MGKKKKPPRKAYLNLLGQSYSRAGLKGKVFFQGGAKALRPRCFKKNKGEKQKKKKTKKKQFSNKGAGAPNLLFKAFMGKQPQAMLGAGGVRIWKDPPGREQKRFFCCNVGHPKKGPGIVRRTIQAGGRGDKKKQEFQGC